ncbi:MAG: YkgJ family cysteine cluster protein [Candidatus Melainabacteria bacterium]
MSLQYELSYIKQHYRELFLDVQAELTADLSRLAGSEPCAAPGCTCAEAQAEDALLSVYPASCGRRRWQQACLHFLEQETGREILTALDGMDAEKNRVDCHQCGVCCRFASSEFSWETLCEKARQGDAFAAQFTSVFLPYASDEAASAAFPELVTAIRREARLQNGDDATGTASDSAAVYFYHCPFIAEDNRCSIYGTTRRPGICARYPETPLSFIYDKCAWKSWKDDNHLKAMRTHAQIELCMFYAARIKAVLMNTPAA